jgi:DNA-directed RNA polymerase subunit RPC12/RpoP
MADPEPEVEIVCPHCGHRMARTPARLRRDIKVLCPECGAEVVPGQPGKPDRL